MPAPLTTGPFSITPPTAAAVQSGVVGINLSTFAPDVLDLSNATITMPTSVDGPMVVQRYVSPVITSAMLTPSGASKIITLTGAPVGAFILGTVVKTSGAVTSSNGSTTGLSIEVGYTADPDSVLKSMSVFGAAGIKTGPASLGVSQLQYEANTLEVKLTATGGAPDVTHIVGLGLTITVLYLGGFA